MEEFHWAKGVAPTSNSEAGLAEAGDIKGKYVSSLAVGENGAITVAFATADANSKIAASQLRFTPDWSNSGSSVWTCNGSGTTLDPKYLPTSCR